MHKNNHSQPQRQNRITHVALLLAIVACAMLFRVIYFHEYRKSLVYPLLSGSDGHYYYMWAKDIASGSLLPESAFLKWPLYAYFVALLLKLSAQEILTVYYVQFCMGVLNCLLVYAIAKKLFNRKVALTTASLYTWYGLFIFYEGLCTYTTLSLFLNSLFFLSLLHIKDAPTKRSVFLAGILLGICAITQPPIAVSGIIAMVWILAVKKLNLQKFAAGLVSFLIGFCIIAGGISVINYIAEKDFVVVSGNVGHNFYLGNNPDATGIFYCPLYMVSSQEGMLRDARIIATQESGRALKSSEVSRFWFKRALVYIYAHPFRYLKLLAKKIAYALSPREFINDNEYPFLEYNIAIFRILFMDLTFVLPCAFVGMWLGLKRLKETMPLYIVFLTLSLSPALFLVTARYRISSVPFGMMFAAYALVALWQMLRERNYKRCAQFCVATLTIGLALNYNPLITGQENAATTAFTVHVAKALEYQLKKDYRAELSRLQDAYRLKPHDQFVVFSLGFAYYQCGDISAAEDSFKEALRINPLFVDAYYNLGFIYNRKNRSLQAEDMLKKALALDPKNMNAHLELALSYKLNANPQGAASEYRLVLKHLKRWQQKERLALEKEINSLATL